MSAVRYINSGIYALLAVGILDLVFCENSTIKLLRQALLKDYDRFARPVQHHHNVTTVKLNFVPRYLFDLDEEKEMIILHGWLILEWEDQHLKWLPEDYNNIQRLTMADHEIWQPDIVIYENIPSKEIDPKKDTHVIVSKNGFVSWVPPILINSQCSLNIQNYPYDKQYCQLTFGSWNHDGSIIDLSTDRNTDIARKLLNRNFKWKIIDINVTREVTHYDCCEEPYVAIIYTFVLERREPIHQKVIWIPNILALLITSMIFWLPPETFHKIAIASVMMLLLTGLLIYLAFSVQSPLAVNIAVSLVHRSMIVVFTAMVIELFVINLSRASIHVEPPSLITNRLSGIFGILLCIPPEIQCSESLREFQSFTVEEENILYKQYPKKGNWRRVAIMIDRISFILFIPTILIILNTKF